MDWDAIWARDPAVLAVGPSSVSRLRVVLPLVKKYGLAGGSLVDVGCGTGLLLAKAASLGTFGRLVGIDISERPFEVARNNCPSGEFVVADVCEAPLAERFGLVTCMMTLDLVPDEERAARHLAEMLEPGGHLIVVTQHSEKYRSELDDRYGVRRHDRTSLEKLFGVHGLELVQLFSWGWPLFSLYYRLLEKSGAGVAGSRAVPSRLRNIVSLGLPLAFVFDDFFKWADRGRVLFGVFQKPW